MLNDTKRGAIQIEDAYAQGKMLSHDAWQNGDWVLPRNITACDIDAVFDNSGRAVLVELTRSAADWKKLCKECVGKAGTYFSLIDGTEHCAVVAQHAVPVAQVICTRTDIISFQVLLSRGMNDFQETETFNGNDRWQAFMRGWFKDAGKLRKQLLAKYGQEIDGL